MPDPPRYLQRLMRNLRRDIEQLRLEEERDARVADVGKLFERLQACRRMHFAARVRGRNLVYAGDRPPPSMVATFFEDVFGGIERAGRPQAASVALAVMEFLSSPSQAVGRAGPSLPV